MKYKTLLQGILFSLGAIMLLSFFISILFKVGAGVINVFSVTGKLNVEWIFFRELPLYIISFICLLIVLITSKSKTNSFLQKNIFAGAIMGCCISFLLALTVDTLSYYYFSNNALVQFDTVAVSTPITYDEVEGDIINPISIVQLNQINIGDTLCEGIVLDKSNDGHGLIYYPVGFNTCNYVNARISVAMQRNDYGKGLVGRLRLPSIEELKMVSQRLLTNPNLTWLGAATRWSCEVQSVGSNGKVAIYDLTKNEKSIVSLADENFLSYVFEY